MKTLEKLLNDICRFFDYMARISVVIMMCIVTADIILRKPWHSIPGNYDYICFLGAMIVAFALPYSAFLKGNICVDLLVSRLPSRIQAFIDALTGTMSFTFFFLVTWQTFIYGNEMRINGEISMDAQLPFYHLVYITSFMCLLVCLVTLLEISKSIIKVVR